MPKNAELVVGEMIVNLDDIEKFDAPGRTTLFIKPKDGSYQTVWNFPDRKTRDDFVLSLAEKIADGPKDSCS